MMNQEQLDAKAKLNAATAERMAGNAATLVLKYDMRGNGSYAVEGSQDPAAPLYVGEPIVGIEQPPYEEFPSVGLVDFIGICSETRCHVYQRAQAAKGGPK
jgi:hypothetical protein